MSKTHLGVFARYSLCLLVGFVLGFISATELASYVCRKNYKENPPLPIVVPEDQFNEENMEEPEGMLLGS